MRILVTGGAGYIGSNMTAMLIRAGHEPVVFDNLSKGHKAAINGCEFVKGELNNFERLVVTLKLRKIEAVMHFAGYIEAGESVHNPLKYYLNNVSNSQVLLSAMKAARVRRLVFSSSAAVYGIPDKTPISENTPKKPINPYGETKLVVEKMCHYLARTGRLQYATLRYFNACGAGADCTLGEDHRPESHLIPLTIYAAMGKTESVKIFGTDYSTPDGTCIRDYIHVEDLCSAHLLALEKLNQQKELVYNLGLGKGYSVREVIDTVKKVSGKDFKVIEAPPRPGDPPELVCDASKAKQELGWQPRWTDLEEIIKSAWQWHTKFPHGYP